MKLKYGCSMFICSTEMTKVEKQVYIGNLWYNIVAREIFASLNLQFLSNSVFSLCLMSLRPHLLAAVWFYCDQG